MSDVVIELGLNNEFEETAFFQAVETFAKSINDLEAGSSDVGKPPEFIVKTVCAANGHLAKRLIFQEAYWANRFMEFFDLERFRAA